MTVPSLIEKPRFSKVGSQYVYTEDWSNAPNGDANPADWVGMWGYALYGLGIRSVLPDDGVMGAPFVRITVPGATNRGRIRFNPQARIQIRFTFRVNVGYTWSGVMVLYASENSYNGFITDQGSPQWELGVYNTISRSPVHFNEGQVYDAMVDWNPAGIGNGGVGQQRVSLDGGATWPIIQNNLRPDTTSSNGPLWPATLYQAMVPWYQHDGCSLDIGPIRVVADALPLWGDCDGWGWDSGTWINASKFEVQEGGTLMGIGGKSVADPELGDTWTGEPWQYLSRLQHGIDGFIRPVKCHFITNTVAGDSVYLIVRAGNNANGYSAGQAFSTAHVPHNDNLAANAPASYWGLGAQVIDLSQIPAGSDFYFDFGGTTTAAAGYNAGSSSFVGMRVVEYAEDSTYYAPTTAPTVIAFPSASFAPSLGVVAVTGSQTGQITLTSGAYPPTADTLLVTAPGLVSGGLGIRSPSGVPMVFRTIHGQSVTLRRITS